MVEDREVNERVDGEEEEEEAKEPWLNIRRDD